MVFPSSLQVHDETGIICQGAESLALAGTFTNWELVEPREGIYRTTETDNLYHWVKLAVFVQCPDWEIRQVATYHTRALRPLSMTNFCQECLAKYRDGYNKVDIKAVIRSQGGSLAEQVFQVQRSELRGVNPTDAVRKAFIKWLEGTPYSQGWTLLSWELLPREAADAWWLSKPNLAPVTA